MHQETLIVKNEPPPDPPWGIVLFLSAGKLGFGGLGLFRWTLLFLKHFLHVFHVLLEESECEICIFCSGFVPHLVCTSRNNWW